jgi:hypothetical protein
VWENDQRSAHADTDLRLLTLQSSRHCGKSRDLARQDDNRDMAGGTSARSYAADWADHSTRRVSAWDDRTAEGALSVWGAGQCGSEDARGEKM